MAYRDDPDLEFLSTCSSDDLEPLVAYLTRDKDGEVRLTEELTISEEYKKYAPDHRRYWKLVAAELQTFGADSIMTMFRGGKGVPYREVLTDVCDKMKVNYNSSAKTEFIEASLLLKILTDSLDKMDESARRELVESLKIKPSGLAAPAIALALQGAVNASGFVAYQVAVIVANAIARQMLGRGLTVAANAGLARAIGAFAGPIGLAVSAALTLLAVSGPAYRITIPAVVQVAFLRSKKAYA